MHPLCPDTASGDRNQLSYTLAHLPMRPSTDPAAWSGGGRKLLLQVQWLDLGTGTYR